MPTPERPSLRRRLEPGRLVVGAIVETAIKAYGAGAAAAAALSDAETVGGKAEDAVKAVPTLVDQYEQARYVVEHREQIQSAITYLNEHTLPRDELERTADESVETLGAIETTYAEVGRARDVLEIDGVGGTIDNVREAIDHVGNAYDARPDLDSLSRLSQVAEQVEPFADQVDVLVPVYYGGLLNVMDNFASDEIAATTTVMVLALALSVVAGRAAGFWVRRGRPGLLARVLQGLGARRFRGWYVDHLPIALGPGLYAAAREHVQREIVADPESALDEDALRELEQWFADRRVTPEAAGSSRGPRPR